MQEYKNVSDNTWSHFIKIGQLHNESLFNEGKSPDLYKYVIDNELELNSSLIISVLIDNIELTENFITENKDYCLSIYRIIQKTNLEEDDIGFSTPMRILRFEQLLKQLFNL